MHKNLSVLALLLEVKMKWVLITLGGMFVLGLVTSGALMTTVFTVFISIVIILLRRVVLGLFLSDEETIRIAITIMMAEVPFYILYVPMETFPSACRKRTG